MLLLLLLLLLCRHTFFRVPAVSVNARNAMLVRRLVIRYDGRSLKISQQQRKRDEGDVPPRDLRRCNQLGFCW